MTDIIDLKRPGAKALLIERESKEEMGYALSAGKEGDLTSAMCHFEESKALKQQAAMLKQTDEMPTVGAGGEVLQVTEGEVPTDKQLARETLLEPTAVNIGASAERLDLLEKAGVSELGVDAAESIDAQNSFEKMMAHQMAACHKMSMDNAQLSQENEDTVEKARAANTSMRAMKTFQEGYLTLHKVRTGGKQVVVVQHVHVTDGGQAVVTGSVKGRGGS